MFITYYRLLFCRRGRKYLMKFKIWELALLTALAVTLLCGFVMEDDIEELSEKLIRIHVVANSDSESDQQLKLEVRDEVLNVLEDMLSDANDKEEAARIINDNISLIEEAAKEEILEQGYPYEVSAKLTVESFPTRDYDTFSLPAGKYTSLRIKIGEAAGQNWWCVVYPNLCTAAATENGFATFNLTEEETMLIKEETAGYTVKFKLIEVFGRLEQLFG